MCLRDNAYILGALSPDPNKPLSLEFCISFSTLHLFSCNDAVLRRIVEFKVETGRLDVTAQAMREWGCGGGVSAHGAVLLHAHNRGGYGLISNLSGIAKCIVIWRNMARIQQTVLLRYFRRGFAVTARVSQRTRVRSRNQMRVLVFTTNQPKCGSWRLLIFNRQKKRMGCKTL